MPALCLSHHYNSIRGFPGSSVVKNLPANAGEAGDMSLSPRLGRSHGEGNGNPLQYFCLENSIDRGAWRATVHGVEKNWTWLSDFYYYLLLTIKAQFSLSTNYFSNYKAQIYLTD